MPRQLMGFLPYNGVDILSMPVPAMPKIKRTFSLPRGYKRLRCKVPQNYQCGGKCQNRDNKCSKNVDGMPKDFLDWAKYIAETKEAVSAINQRRSGGRTRLTVDDLGFVKREKNPDYQPGGIPATAQALIDKAERERNTLLNQVTKDINERLSSRNMSDADSSEIRKFKRSLMSKEKARDKRLNKLKDQLKNGEISEKVFRDQFSKEMSNGLKSIKDEVKRSFDAVDKLNEETKSFFDDAKKDIETGFNKAMEELGIPVPTIDPVTGAKRSTKPDQSIKEDAPGGYAKILASVPNDIKEEVESEIGRSIASPSHFDRIKEKYQEYAAAIKANDFPKGYESHFRSKFALFDPVVKAESFINQRRAAIANGQYETEVEAKIYLQGKMKRNREYDYYDSPEYAQEHNKLKAVLGDALPPPLTGEVLDGDIKKFLKPGDLLLAKEDVYAMGKNKVIDSKIVEKGELVKVGPKNAKVKSTWDYMGNLHTSESTFPLANITHVIRGGNRYRVTDRLSTPQSPDVQPTIDPVTGAKRSQPAQPVTDGVGQSPSKKTTQKQAQTAVNEAKGDRLLDKETVQYLNGLSESELEQLLTPIANKTDKQAIADSINNLVQDAKKAASLKQFQNVGDRRLITDDDLANGEIYLGRGKLLDETIEYRATRNNAGNYEIQRRESIDGEIKRWGDRDDKEYSGAKQWDSAFEAGNLQQFNKYVKDIASIVQDDLNPIVANIKNASQKRDAIPKKTPAKPKKEQPKPRKPSGTPENNPIGYYNFYIDSIPNQGTGSFRDSHKRKLKNIIAAIQAPFDDKGLPYSQSAKKLRATANRMKKLVEDVAAEQEKFDIFDDVDPSILPELKKMLSEGLLGKIRSWETLEDARLSYKNDAGFEEKLRDFARKNGRAIGKTVLGIPVTGNYDKDYAKVKSAYRKLVKQHHPDKGGDAEKFREIQAEWERYDQGKPANFGEPPSLARVNRARALRRKPQIRYTFR